MSLLNKSISLFISVVLILLSIPSVSVLKTEASAITTAYIEGENVRVRETPSTKNNDNVLDRISYTSATVIEKKEISKTEIWYKISYNNSNGEKITGYILYDADYIRILTYNPDAKFEEKIKAFPKSYQDALRSLHAKYPKWEFIPDPVNSSFNASVAEQLTNMRKQVQIGSSAHPISWRSMGLGSYDWNKKAWVNTNGGWTGASKEVVAYYMDPRNFLNDTEIYMFLEQSYNSAVQNDAGIKKIIKGTFLEKKYTNASGEPGGGSYLSVIKTAAQKSGVNPYIIASKIIQEQGVKGTSSLISGTYSGYKGYYNFFNIGAYGSSATDVIVNGLKRAKANGWNTRYKSILGGAQFLGNNYISKGQDTYYYQDFNVHGDGTHQYAQAVHDAYNKGVSLAETYKSQEDMSLSFKIPVFTDMPSNNSPMPPKNSKKNNYYFSKISVDGLTPSFNMYTTKYNLAVSKDTVIKVKTVGDGATNASKAKYTLTKGVNKVVLSVKSESGYLNYYTITVNASKNCNLYVKPETGDNQSSGDGMSGNGDSLTGSDSSDSSANDKILKGDTNGDGKLTIIDLAKIQMHLLNKKSLKDNYFKAGDINSDGKITIIDLARIQMHLLGVKLIEI